jgi:hypothetical protein
MNVKLIHKENHFSEDSMANRKLRKAEIRQRRHRRDVRLKQRKKEQILKAEAKKDKMS